MVENPKIAWETSFLRFTVDIIWLEMACHGCINFHMLVATSVFLPVSCIQFTYKHSYSLKEKYWMFIASFSASHTSCFHRAFLLIVRLLFTNTLRHFGQHNMHICHQEFMSGKITHKVPMSHNIQQEIQVNTGKREGCSWFCCVAPLSQAPRM